MAKNSKPRKAHRQKYVARNVLEVFGGMGSTHGEHLREVQTKTYMALEDMIHGRGTRENWDMVVGAINMSNVMCEQGIGNEFRETTIAARDALLEVGKRILLKNIVALKGEELKVIREALEMHDAQLENIRAIDVDRAFLEVQRRIRNGINSTNVRDEVRSAGLTGG